MFNQKHDCNVHGHRFEPRYDEVPLDGGKAIVAGALNIALQIHGIEFVRELWVRRVYRGDVCVRCGQTASLIVLAHTP